MKKTKRTLAEKMSIFKGFFIGLRNAYGTYDVATGRVRQVKEPVTDKVIRDHLTGKQSYGVYLLMGNKTGALAVDFDENEIKAGNVVLEAGRKTVLTTGEGRFTLKNLPLIWEDDIRIGREQPYLDKSIKNLKIMIQARQAEDSRKN
jgi:hypothetical protein